MSKVECLILAAYGTRFPGTEGSGYAPDCSDWPQPGILRAIQRWPSTTPPITAEQLNKATNLLSELSATCNFVLLSARNAYKGDEFSSFVERVKTAYNDHKLLLRDAAWAVGVTNLTSDRKQCGSVTMPTMHSAVLQMACNIAGWPATHETIDNYRQWITQSREPSLLNSPDPSQLIDVSDVQFALESEARIARTCLLAVTPATERLRDLSQRSSCDLPFEGDYMMSGPTSWLASWTKLRGEAETLSLTHTDVHLCLWQDVKFSVPQPNMRICNVLHLNDHWFAASSKGNPTKTKIRRQLVMGIGALQSVGPSTWWLMHGHLAKASQRSRGPDATVAMEMECASDVQKKFENLAEHASDLLRNIPNGAGIRLADDVAKVTGMYLWIMVLFDIAGLHAGDPTRVQGAFPSFVPANCLGAEAMDVFPDLRVLRRNPFCESVAVIDWLTQRAKAPSEAFVPNDFQREILNALDGRALKKQALAIEVCAGEGSRLYRPGGIKELMNGGHVVNKRRLGYYRPDRPPPPP